MFPSNWHADIAGNIKMSIGITDRADPQVEDERVGETFAIDEKVAAEKEADVLHSKVLINQQLMNDAVDGENREHEMSMLAAMKQYPWACFWGFVMCFTIVSLFPRILEFALVPRFRIAEIRVFCGHH